MAGQVYHDGRWLRVIDLGSFGGKTQRFEIRAKKGDLLLGWIRWYGSFRCYSFCPCEGTVWEPDCLGDILAVLKRLKEERRPQGPKV